MMPRLLTAAFCLALLATCFVLGVRTIQGVTPGGMIWSVRR